MDPADAAASISLVKDIKSGSVNDLLTPGRNLRISGNKIKVAGEHPDNGIFFVDAAGARTRVDADEIVTNNPSEVIIVIPALPSGVYTLEIVTQYAARTFLKDPRIAVFNKPLTVQ